MSADYKPVRELGYRKLRNEPLNEGDFLHFGCAGTEQPDGSYFGGSGFIEASKRSGTYMKYPFRRISHDTIIQDWDAVPESV